jgi:hypothetical protein
MLGLLLLLLLVGAPVIVDALMIKFNIHSVMREYKPETVNILMHSFEITKQNLEVVACVLSTSLEFEYHYCNQHEPVERVDALLLHTNLPYLH